MDWKIALAGLLTVLCSGGVGVLIAQLFQRNRTRSESSKLDKEGDKIYQEGIGLSLQNEQTKIKAAAEAAKVVETLLKTTMEQTAQIAKMSGEFSQANMQISKLVDKLNVADGIIEYQKTEQGRWQDKLETLATRSAESEARERQCNERLNRLEEIFEAMQLQQTEMQLRVE